MSRVEYFIQLVLFFTNEVQCLKVENQVLVGHSSRHYPNTCMSFRLWQRNRLRVDLSDHTTRGIPLMKCSKFAARRALLPDSRTGTLIQQNIQHGGFLASSFWRNSSFDIIQTIEVFATKSAWMQEPYHNFSDTHEDGRDIHIWSKGRGVVSYLNNPQYSSAIELDWLEGTGVKGHWGAKSTQRFIVLWSNRRQGSKECVPDDKPEWICYLTTKTLPGKTRLICNKLIVILDIWSQFFVE